MRVACMADIHAHLFKEFDSPTDRSGSKRLDHIIDSVVKTGEYCVDNDIKYLLIAGDVFNTRGKVATKVLNAMYDALEELCKMGLTVVALPGNHDDDSNADTPNHSLHTFKRISSNMHVLSRGEVFDDGVLSVLGITYTRDVESTKEIINNSPDCDVLLFHLGLSGSIGGGGLVVSEPFVLEDLYPEKFKYLVGGHYHKKQFIEESPNAFYCGAPIQHSFNDEGDENGFFVIDTKVSNSVQFVPILSPRFITLDANEVNPTILERHKREGNYIRIKATEDTVQSIDNIPEGLNVKTEITKEYHKNDDSTGIRMGMGFEEVVSKYAEAYSPAHKSMGIDILSSVMMEVE